MMFKKIRSILLVFGLLLLNIIPVSASTVPTEPELRDIEILIAQDNQIIEDNFDSTKPITIGMSFGIPVVGDNDTDPYFEVGDVVEFTLTDAFQMATSPLEFDLKQGEVWIGQLVLSNETYEEDGKTKNGVKATITMNDGPKQSLRPNPAPDYEHAFDGNHYNVVASFNVELSYDNSGENGTEGDHQVHILEKTYTVNVPVVPVVYTMEKSSSRTDQQINWMVKVDADKGENNYDLNGYEFFDDISDSGTYVSGSFKVGSTNVEADATEVDDASASENVLSYTFNEETLGDRYFFYSTTISDEDYSSLTDLSYENTAVLRLNEETVKESNTETVDVEKTWITKSHDLTEDIPGNHAELKYTITANTLNASLSDAIIKDVLDSRLEFVSAQMQVLNKVSGAFEDYGSMLTSEPVDGEYLFGDVDSTIRVIIDTDVADSQNISYSRITINNTAQLLIGSEETLVESASTGAVGVGRNPIRKFVQNIDYSKNTIEWRVNLRETEGFGDLRVLDLLVYDDSDSGFNFDSSLYTIENNSSGDLNYVNPDIVDELIPSYNQKYESTYSSNPSGTTVEVRRILNDDAEAVADLIIITNDGSGLNIGSEDLNIRFTTKITNPDIYAGNTNIQVRNIASLYAGNDSLNRVTRNVSYQTRMLAKEMLSVTDAIEPINNFDKPGETDVRNSYNYVNNSVVYRLEVNSNEIDTTDPDSILTNIVVSDQLPTGWEFVPLNEAQDYAIFEYDEENWIEVTYDGNHVYTLEDSSLVSFGFESLKNRHYILLKAQPTAETLREYFSTNKLIESIENTANIMADELSSPKVVSQDITIESEILDKTFTTEDEGGILNWSIEYKSYNLMHTDLNLEDQIPMGLDLRTNSLGELDIEDSKIKITEIILQADGTYDDGDSVTVVLDSNVTYDPMTRILNFDIPDGNKSYRFEYTTDITAGVGANLTNTVRLSGSTLTNTSSGRTYEVSMFDSAASLQRAGSVSIHKMDGSGQNLAGATIGIYTTTGVLLRSGVTGADGMLSLRGLRAGEYILREISAPVGYVLSPLQLSVSVTAIGQTIITSIDGQTGEDANTITMVNYLEGSVGNLGISKEVTGNDSDTEQEFTFSVTVGTISGTYAYIGSGGKADGTLEFFDGNASLTLKHGESVIISNLPQGVSYTVTETDADTLGYSSSSLNASGNIVADTVITSSFVNTKNKVVSSGANSDYPDTGDDFQSTTYLTVGLISMILAGILLLIKRKVTVK